MTKLIMSRVHKLNLYAGPLVLLSFVRQRYWPLHGKSLAKTVVHHCVLCARSRPILQRQIMGNLPADRVQPS